MSKFVDRLSITDESGDVKKEININFGDPLAREQSQKAMQTSEQAKQIAQEAKDAVPGQVSQQVEEATRELSGQITEATQELSGQITEAKQTANEAKQIAQNTYVKDGVVQWTDNELLNQHILSCGYNNASGHLANTSSNIVGVSYTIKRLKVVSNSFETIIFKCESLGIAQYLRNGYNEVRISSNEIIYIVLNDSLVVGTYSFYFNADVLYPFNPQLGMWSLADNQLVMLEALEREQRLKDLALSNVLIEKIYNDNTINFQGIATSGKLVSVTTPLSDNTEEIRYGNISNIYLMNCSSLTSFKNIFIAWNGYNRILKSVSGLFGYDHLTGDAFQQMFYRCIDLESVEFIPNKEPISVTNISSMFADDAELKYINLDALSFGSVELAAYIFTGTKNLKRVRLPELPGVKNIEGMFHVCYYIEEIDMNNVDCSSVTKTLYFANNCTALKAFSGLIDIKKSYQLSESSVLSYDSALNCIDGLHDLTEEGTVTDYTAQTLTFHPNVTAQLDDEDIAMATAKGWNIA